MVLLFVDQAAHKHRQRRVKQQQQMEFHRGNRAVQHHAADILDRAVHRIAQEDALDHRGIAVHRVEDGRHIHQQHREHVIQVLNIPEEYIQGGQDQAHADVEHHQAEDRVQDRHEFPGERHAVDRRKDEEHHQRQTEIDDRGHVLRQQEDILGHVDLRKDVLVRHQGVHAAFGCFLII